MRVAAMTDMIKSNYFWVNISLHTTKMVEYSTIIGSPAGSYPSGISNESGSSAILPLGIVNITNLYFMFYPFFIYLSKAALLLKQLLNDMSR